jgi:hypothetical protein
MITIRASAAALAVTLLIGGMAHPAFAQRDRRDERHRVVHRPPPRPAWGYRAPSYVEAPPPVVYAPPAPPPLVYSPPGISLSVSIP